jgi:hypothetical protein
LQPVSFWPFRHEQIDCKGGGNFEKQCYVASNDTAFVQGGSNLSTSVSCALTAELSILRPGAAARSFGWPLRHLFCRPINSHVPNADGYLFMQAVYHPKGYAGSAQARHYARSMISAIICAFVCVQSCDSKGLHFVLKQGYTLENPATDPA